MNVLFLLQAKKVLTNHIELRIEKNYYKHVTDFVESVDFVENYVSWGFLDSLINLLYF